jgi:hypothetical protein
MGGDILMIFWKSNALRYPLPFHNLSVPNRRLTESLTFTVVARRVARPWPGKRVLSCVRSDAASSRSKIVTALPLHPEQFFPGLHSF